MISRTISVSARIPLDRLDQLEELASDMKVRPTDIVRDALYEYMDEHKVTPPGEQS
jgi:predicted transcriptional regulator